MDWYVSLRSMHLITWQDSKRASASAAVDYIARTLRDMDKKATRLTLERILAERWHNCWRQAARTRNKLG